jgi:acyl carrier protein
MPPIAAAIRKEQPLELRARILEVFKNQFNLTDIADVGLPFEELRMGAIDEWDSLGNLNLLLAIENEFSIRLSTEQLSSIDSLLQLESMLKDQVK